MGYSPWGSQSQTPQKRLGTQGIYHPTYSFLHLTNTYYELTMLQDLGVNKREEVPAFEELASWWDDTPGTATKQSDGGL